MSDRTNGGSDLVMTQAELPPGTDAPSPPAERDRIAAGDPAPADVERDLRRLADRAGGWDRLRRLVDQLGAGAR
jgi:hypothetical protein